MFNTEFYIKWAEYLQFKYFRALAEFWCKQGEIGLARYWNQLYFDARADWLEKWIFVAREVFLLG